MRGPARRRTARRASDDGLGLRLSLVFSVPFCPRPGFQKTVERRPFDQFPNTLLSKKLRQKLRQIACRKGSKNVSRLRLILKKTNVLQTLHLPC